MRRRTAVLVAVVALSLALSPTLGACATATTSSSGPSAAPDGTTSAAQPGAAAPYAGTSTTPTLRTRHPAWVAVSVATLWRSPRSPREVDTPALASPARITQWLAAMSVEERRGLGGRADTQALLGDRVRVLRLRGAWARVVVPSQPGPRDRRGYPGWVPRRQLTPTRPAVTDRVATVIRRTAWLSEDPGGRRLYRVSFGTELPVLAERATFVQVVAPTGQVRRLARTAVTVHDRATAALAAGRPSVVRTALSFRGLPYLWAGVSGFGLDCSGLTWLSYRVHGIRIPRDAAPQSQGGRAVHEPRRADLLFYARSGVVHHVSMYIGRGRMVHSPRTGDVVKVSPTSAPTYAREFAGARHFLP